MINRQKHVRSV